MIMHTRKEKVSKNISYIGVQNIDATVGINNFSPDVDEGAKERIAQRRL